MDAGAMNPVSGVVRALENVVKKEVEEKPEMVECAVCLERCTPGADLRGCTTAGTPLLVFLAKFSRNDDINITRQLCHTCLHLINDLEQAELEYIKVKDTFEAIIRNNPMFNQCSNSLDNVKVEIELGSFVSHDSEDEPLAVTKKKRNQKGVKRKKNTTGTAKRGRPRKKSVSKDSSWSCGVCGARSDVGGVAGLTAHQLVAHLHPEGLGKALKKEDSGDGSESSHFNNGLESLKTEIDFGGVDDDDDDDDDGVDNYVPDLYNERTKRVVGRPRKIKLIPPQERKRISKTVHKCADCDAKFTSLKRFEQHQEKHHEGKPPFICEVCGARYKHKRACDIHVALHQGISDWKCEECNKLFPSKGALQRHNNIHTGKLNYQCDLCGKSFIHTSSFKMHKLSHSGVKPHACDVCGLALMTRSHLKRHKRVHSGEKRHECPVCGKRFSERYNLAAHSKSHSEAGAPPCPLPPRRRLFRCPYCPERFERRYMLERHAPAAHGTALERAPPTPRNTMSKLLKAQAQARLPPGDATDTKEERSPDSQKLQITSPSPTVTVTAGSWSGVYAAEFGIRHDYAH